MKQATLLTNKEYNCYRPGPFDHRRKISFPGHATILKLSLWWVAYRKVFKGDLLGTTSDV
jgi:hypothetical protein